jgi:hypothetical protein
VEPSDVQQAHRAARRLRFALYPLAAVLLAMLLIGRDQAAGSPVTTKYGATTQGRRFELGLDAKGRPAAFDTELVALCPTGRLITMPWSPVDGDDVRFRRDGDRLRATERGDGWELGLDARSDGGGVLHGTLSLIVHVRPETRAPFDCRSRNVRFTVRR